MDTSNKSLRLTRDLSHEKGKKYPPEKRIEVCTKWMALGNLRLVSELTGVSYQLCRLWKTQPWWADLVAEIKASRDIQVDNKLSKLVDRSLEIVGDRLENGDIIWNKKTGEYDRQPVSLAAVNKVADTLLTQQLNLSKKKVVEQIGDKAQSVQDQIKLLAQEFAKFNSNRTINVHAKVIDNAVHDQREEGLQKAVPELRWSPGSDQEAGRAEQGSSDAGEGGDCSQGGWEGRGPHEADEQGWEDSSLEPEGGESEGQSFLL